MFIEFHRKQHSDVSASFHTRIWAIVSMMSCLDANE